MCLRAGKLAGPMGKVYSFLSIFACGASFECLHSTMYFVCIHAVYLSLNSKSAAIARASLFSLSAFTFSTSFCTSYQGTCTRKSDENFMLQLVTAWESRQEISQPSIIIPEEAPLEEGPAPAGVPYVSPERRHPPAIGHEQPIHTKQKQNSQ